MTVHRDRVALITGGSQGIGRAVSELLAQQGASVCVLDRDVDGARATVQRIHDAGGRAIWVEADVRDSGGVSAGVQEAVGTFGGLDILVTAAGVQRYGDTVTTEEETWDEVMDVNLKGVFLVAHHALPHMRRRGTGAVVVISSVQAYVSQATVAAYTASKGGLNALVRSMAIDESSYGIRVNSVCPASVDTPMLRRAASAFAADANRDADELVRTWGMAHPLGRVAEPGEIAEVVSFLASKQSSFVTGADIKVDGGLLATVAVSLPD